MRRTGLGRQVRRRGKRGIDAMVDLASKVGGFQAQVPQAASVAMHARIRGLTKGEFDEALASCRVVRTWSLRGTAHIHAAGDLGLLTSTMGSILEAAWVRYASRTFGLTQLEVDRLVHAARRALADGALSRRELADRVAACLGPWSRPFVQEQWGGVAKLMAYRGEVVFGPTRGNETTFALGPAPPAPRAKASLTDLLRRYLAVYAPAGPRDFAYWAGLAARDVAPAWGELARAEDLVPVQAGEHSLGMALREDVKEIEDTTPDDEVHLLPHFEILLLSHRDRSLFLAPRFRSRIVRPAGWIAPVIVGPAGVIASWSRHGSRINVHRLSKKEPMDVGAVRERVDALEDFLGAPLSTRFA
ncbi:MAG: winged helix DNA-binding domain-containing protein [Thermoplasmatota archaeon]